MGNSMESAYGLNEVMRTHTFQRKLPDVALRKYNSAFPSPVSMVPE